MVQTVTENSQLATEMLVPIKHTNQILRSSRFKYYIHDGIGACRFQLIGRLTEADIADLQGCWRTVKTTLGERKLILDLRDVQNVDEAGKNWLASMAAEGAEYLREPAPAENIKKPGRFRKLAAIFRNLRLPSVDSSTQAQ
jgi:ABC-type transporter Mla MlaB component